MAWEWSNAEEYPGYIKHTAEAYRMMINEIVFLSTEHTDAMVEPYVGDCRLSSSSSA